MLQVTNLERFLETMRTEIRTKAEQFKNLGKPHRFPCPYCSKDVEVEYGTDGVSYTLKHRGIAGCLHCEKPDKHTRGDLVHAFVFHCRPSTKYGALDGLEKESIL